MKKILIFALLLICFITSLFALDSKDILDRMEKEMDFSSASFSATIVNTDKLGSTKLTFDTYQKGNGDTLLIVTSGSDKGQKILRLGEEIYIFYPNADEIIRLSSSGLKESFLGSDFSYEDLTGDDEYDERYSHYLSGEETLNDIDCFVISMDAKKRSETYQKETMYIAKASFLPVKMSLYSKSGRLLKEIYYSDYITDNGTKYPTHIEIKNAVKKSSYSVMDITSISFGVELNEDLFDKENISW